MKYEFDKENHIHKLDGVPLHGVTTVLSVIAKPALIQWSANMACSYIKDNLPSMKEMTENPDLLLEILEDAKYAHRRNKEKAGDFGTNVHKAIEKWIKDGKEPKKLNKNEMIAFNNFKNWAKENEIKFIESEKHIYSKGMWIGGILDLVFEMDGKKFIGDIKTSSGIYDEAFFQMGAYNLCLEEMGEHQDVEGYIVINLRKDGKMDLKRADNMQINKKAFEYALGLHKILKSIQ